MSISGGSEATQADRPGRRDVDRLGLLALDEGQRLRERRHAHVERLVARDRERPVRRKGDEAGRRSGAAADHLQRELAVVGGGGQ